MRRRVFDTDTFSLYRRGNAGILSHLAENSDEEVFLSVFTLEEALTGWYTVLRKAQTDAQIVVAYQRMEEVAPHLARFPMLPVTEAAMARYRILKKARINIGASDLQIAALVLEYDAILVTRNLRDFERVPGLTVENWAS